MRPTLFILTLALLLQTAKGDSLEEWVEASEQPEAVQEWLDDLRANPIDLNSASLGEISRLPFFDKVSATRLIENRRNTGGFRNLTEITRLSVWTTEQRETLAAFTTVVPIPLGKARVNCAVQSSSVVRSALRGDFTSHRTTSGFIYVRGDGESPGAVEDVSVGVEYQALHWKLLAGDFQFESGSTLVFGSSHGGGSWLSSAGSVMPGSAAGLRSKPTADALASFRGIGAQFAPGLLKASLFGSERQLDAELNESGVERIAEEDAASEALQAARDGQITERLIGGEVRAAKGWWEGGISGHRAQFSPPFDPEQSLEQPHAIHGAHLHVGGLYMRASVMGIETTLEAAKSDPGGLAHQASLSAAGEQLALAIYHVYAAPDFCSVHGKSWSGFEGETGNVQRTGIRLRLRHSRFEHMVDAWNSVTPFRTAASPLRKESGGAAWRSNIILSPLLSVRLLASKGWNEETASAEPSEFVALERGQIEAIVHQSVEWRVRFDIRARRDNGTQSTALFVQAKRRFAATAISLRVTVFDVENSDVAVRLYEDAPRGVFPLIAMYHSGSRMAAMLSRQWGAAKLTVKVAHTEWLTTAGNEDSFDGAVQMSLDW